jgi:hypothetical protein
MAAAEGADAALAGCGGHCRRKISTRRRPSTARGGQAEVREGRHQRQGRQSKVVSGLQSVLDGQSGRPPSQQFGRPAIWWHFRIAPAGRASSLRGCQRALCGARTAKARQKSHGTGDGSSMSIDNTPALRRATASARRTGRLAMRGVLARSRATSCSSNACARAGKQREQWC